MILDSPTLAGNPVEAPVAKGNIAGTAAFDLSTGSYFTATVTGATTVTLTSSAGGIRGALIKLTNAGTFLTFSPALKWTGGTAGAFTAAGVDFLSIMSDDGVNFYASLVMRDVK